MICNPSREGYTVCFISEVSFSSIQGVVTPTKTAVVAGRWMNIADATSGLVMLSHVSNPEPNNHWILREKSSMQNVAYPGRECITLSKAEPLRLRYRLVIHDGSLTANQLGGLLSEYDRT